MLLEQGYYVPSLVIVLPGAEALRARGGLPGKLPSLGLRLWLLELMEATAYRQQLLSLRGCNKRDAVVAPLDELIARGRPAYSVSSLAPSLYEYLLLIIRVLLELCRGAWPLG
jgi:hypothetical protein